MIEGIQDRIYYLLFKEVNYGPMPFIWRCLYGLMFFSKAQKDFAHIDFFFVNGYDKITFVAMSPWQLSIVDTTLDPDTFIDKVKEEYTACVEVKSETVTDGFRPRGLITCVSLVKAMLGIRKFWIVRPKKLFDWITKNGGKTLWEH